MNSIQDKSAHQPIRLAGSIYHKNKAKKLVSILKYKPIEYELQDLIIRAETLPEPTLLESKNKPFEQVLIKKIYSGGTGNDSKFNNISRVAGFWIRRYFDGLISKKEAIEEIEDYNLANMVPAWPQERLEKVINSLWQLHQNKSPEKKNTYEHNSTSTYSTNRDKSYSISSYSLGSFLDDTSKIPDDLIAPRILTAGGIFVFGGAPKIGKSDFLLSLFVHMAAGKEFNGFIPPRPLKVFYLQTEIGYHYLRERLQNIQLPKELLRTAKDNLYITPNVRLLLDSEGVESLSNHIIKTCPDKPDIIVIDPIRNVFAAGENGARENDNDSMLFFLQKNIELLRDNINSEAGIVLVHHTKKLTLLQLEEDPFQALSGASSLRGYYSTGAIFYKPDDHNTADNKEYRKLIFELRNGPSIAPKLLYKNGRRWNICSDKVPIIPINRRLDTIIELLEYEAKNGRFYMMHQFANKFADYSNLGKNRVIYNECSLAASNGIIKFFNNPKDYGVNTATLKGYGFMCTENMFFREISIIPTHCKESGKKKKIKNNQYWIKK